MAMGKEFFETYPPARKIFELADRISGMDLSGFILQGPQGKLNLTAISQPAILTVSYATLLALEEKTHLRGEVSAGLSLGEYSALVYGRAILFEDALKIVLKRGAFMQEACDKTPGGMSSIMGLNREKIEEIVREGSSRGILAVANYNSPNQIVVSGEKKALQWAGERCKEAGARMVIDLQVAGAYHSPLMELAQEKLAPHIEEASFCEPQIPIISNVTAREVGTVQEIRENLILQVTRPVRWWDSMDYLVSQGLEEGWEIGPGTVLKGLMKQIRKEVSLFPISDLESLKPWEKEGK